MEVGSWREIIRPMGLMKYLLRTCKTGKATASPDGGIKLKPSKPAKPINPTLSARATVFEEIAMHPTESRYGVYIRVEIRDLDGCYRGANL